MNKVDVEGIIRNSIWNSFRRSVKYNVRKIISDSIEGIVWGSVMDIISSRKREVNVDSVLASLGVLSD